MPVISKSAEKVTVLNSKVITVKKDSASIKVSADQTLITLPTTSGRIFNYVPGFEAIPLSISANEATIQFEIMNL